MVVKDHIERRIDVLEKLGFSEPTELNLAGWHTCVEANPVLKTFRFRHLLGQHKVVYHFARPGFANRKTVKLAKLLVELGYDVGKDSE
jgi:hypothetical protein